MASYIAHNQTRDTVTIMLSKAEAQALADLADHADRSFGHFGDDRNGMTKAACARALRAVEAATNTSARRAGYFDV
jgi:GTP-sensing pleiotropic transcriptional regulator CodY